MTQLALSVVVFFYGGLSDGNLRIMAETMEKVLATTKMNITVTVCRVESLPEPCNGSIEDLALRVLETAPETSAPVLLGFAVRGSPIASIYLDRIRERLWSDSTLSMGLLAGIIASHEIGHLLLQNNGHAKTGLMVHGLSLKNLEMKFDQWSFSTQEIKRIQQVRLKEVPLG